MLCFFTISPLFSPPSPFLWIDIYRVFLEHKGQMVPDTICFLRFFCIIYFYEINKSPPSFLLCGINKFDREKKVESRDEQLGVGSLA